MSSVNLLGIFSMVMLVILIFTGLNFVAVDVEDNANLDLKSQAIITYLNNDIEGDYNLSNFEEQDTDLTTNSTFEGVDAFSRQYLEDKSEIQQKKGIIDRALDTPDMVIRSMGIENNGLIITLKVFFGVFVSFVIGLAIYIAVRTGEVK